MTTTAMTQTTTQDTSSDPSRAAVATHCAYCGLQCAITLTGSSAADLAVTAHEGSRDTSRCAEQLGARPTLLAQPSPVGREAARRDGEVGR